MRSTHSRATPVDVARKAGAVERVDDEVGAVRVERLGRRGCAAIALGGERGVALQRAALAEERELDAIAALREQPRRR